VIAAKLNGVVILQGGGHFVEYVQERSEGLVGEFGGDY